MRKGWIAIAFFAMLAVPTAAFAHSCTCKHKGGDAKQGEIACIRTSKGQSLARCDMVLNNSSWTILDVPCEVEQSGRMIGAHDQQS